MANNIIPPRENWFVTNTTNNNLSITDIPSIPIIKPGQRIDLLLYARLTIVQSSTVLSSYISKGWLIAEPYLHTHDDKADLTDVTPLINNSNADNLHKHSHNQLDNLNNGDYIHLTKAEKIDFTQLTDGSNADNLHVHESTGGISVHNELTEIQGGVNNQYYHLTQTQHDTLIDGSSADNLHTHDSKANISHTHVLSNIVDVTATPTAINQALDGISLSVTSLNLNTLTNGSNADTLHTHSSSGTTPDHNDLNGLNDGDYKHLTSDEKDDFDILTNDSNADSLHTHNHDSLEGVVTNEHINHSAINLSAGSGISGGGDITSNRIFSLDINGLTSDTSINSSDTIPIYDGDNKKITFSNLEDSINHANINNLNSSTYYHLSEDNHNTLTSGGNADSLHIHTSSGITGLNEDEILFGSSTGEIEQDSNLTWTGSILTISSETDTSVIIQAEDVSNDAILTVKAENTSNGGDAIINIQGGNESSSILNFKSAVEMNWNQDEDTFQIISNEPIRIGSGGVPTLSGAGTFFVQNDAEIQGVLTVGNNSIQIDGDNFTITSTDGNISFDDENLTTTGTGNFNDIILGTGTVIQAGDTSADTLLDFECHINSGDDAFRLQFRESGTALSPELGAYIQYNSDENYLEFGGFQTSGDNAGFRVNRNDGLTEFINVILPDTTYIGLDYTVPVSLVLRGDTNGAEACKIVLAESSAFGAYIKYDGATNDLILGTNYSSVETDAIKIFRISSGDPDVTILGDLTVNNDLTVNDDLYASDFYSLYRAFDFHSLPSATINNDTLVQNIFIPYWATDSTNNNNYIGFNQNELFAIHRLTNWDITKKVGAGSTTTMDEDDGDEIFSHILGDWLTYTDDVIITLESNDGSYIPIRADANFDLVMLFRNISLSPASIKVEAKDSTDTWIEVMDNPSTDSTTSVFTKRFSFSSPWQVRGLRWTFGKKAGSSLGVEALLLLHKTAPVLEFLRRDGGTVYGDISLARDDDAIYFGADQDASIYFDGTDLNIDLDGTSTGGTINLNDDVNIAGSTTVGGSASGVSVVIEKGLIVNEGGTGADFTSDLRVETLNNSNALIVDASEDEVLINVPITSDSDTVDIGSATTSTSLSIYTGENNILAYPLDILGGHSSDTGTGYMQISMGYFEYPTSGFQISGFSQKHSDTGEEDIQGLFCLVDSSASEARLGWGGGNGALNAATSHLFYTAADITTRVGTVRYEIKSDGTSDFKSNNLEAITDIDMSGDLRLNTNTSSIFLGENQETFINYDGTDFNIGFSDPSTCDLDHVIRINDDLVIEGCMYLEDTVWDDSRAPASTISIFGLGTDPSFDSTNIGYLFDSSSTETLYIIMQIPHSYKEGSNIRPHIHWEPTDTNTGYVTWQMEYKWTNIDDTEAVSFTTISIDSNGDGTAYKHQVAPLPEIDGTGKKISSILSIKLSRLGGSDTYTGDALLKEFDIHYQINSLGSREEYIK